MYYVCIQIYFDMYLLFMIKARIRWCTCRVEKTLGKLLSLWFCFLLHFFCFWYLKPLIVHTKIISSYELARPIMGTIFLVNTDYWASEASPTLGCSIEISRDIYIYICRYVCRGPKKRRRNYVGQTRACSKSVLGVKILPVTPTLLISTIRYSSFSMDGRETFT